jgi:sensor histidine kinase YesM
MLKPSDIFAKSSISPKRALTYNLIFCLTLALITELTDDEDPFFLNLAFTLGIGLLAQLFATFSIKLLHKYNAWIQWAAMLDSILLATFITARFSFWLSGADQNMPDDLLYYVLIASLPFGLFFGLIILWVFYSRAKVTRAEAERLKLELSAETNAKQLSQAQLNLLQAQIEPHFLFNTLATVHSLIEETPKQASSMLERVNDYLRAALDHSRSNACLLSDETDLLRAYLDIMRMRMGGRLHFDIIVDKSAAKLSFPPMLLQPLVENAIKHGLEPKVEGGTLQISGMVKDKKLCLDVIDSGVGFENFKGEGVGLSNVRERLQNLYGDKAVFHISALGHRGVMSSIQIPVELL